MNKKGQVMQNLGALGVGVAALCIVLVVTFLIMAQANSNMQADSSACPSGYVYQNSTVGCCVSGTTLCSGGNITGYSEAYNATGTLTNAAATIPNWVSIIIITAIGSLLIGMVAMFRR